MTCRPWNRWWHQRLRDADRKFMLPLLMKQAFAQRKAGAFSEAWELFKAQPGQEHWHCACANAEFAERVLTVVDELQREDAAESSRQ